MRRGSTPSGCSGDAQGRPPALEARCRVCRSCRRLLVPLSPPTLLPPVPPPTLLPPGVSTTDDGGASTVASSTPGCTVRGVERPLLFPALSAPPAAAVMGVGEAGPAAVVAGLPRMRLLPCACAAANTCACAAAAARMRASMEVGDVVASVTPLRLAPRFTSGARRKATRCCRSARAASAAGVSRNSWNRARSLLYGEQVHTSSPPTVARQVAPKHAVSTQPQSAAVVSGACVSSHGTALHAPRST